LVAGEMSYKQGAARHVLVVGGGYAEVLDNVMTVLASAAEFASEIDTARAQRAKERAEKRLGELNFEDAEYGQQEEAQQRALARLQVASKETRR
jgi:F-type H+-transporting ATPase subunit epsilon